VSTALWNKVNALDKIHENKDKKKKNLDSRSCLPYPIENASILPSQKILMLTLSSMA
jgi:hypothetical protein